MSNESKVIESAVKDAILAAGISYRITPTGERDRDGWKCDGWLFTFQRGRSGKPVEFEYFTGTGHRKPVSRWMPNISNYSSKQEHDKATARAVAPEVAGMIHSFVMDDPQGQDFSEWCANYGSDEDSRKALETYESCQKQTKKAREFFGRELFAKFGELVEGY